VVNGNSAGALLPLIKENQSLTVNAENERTNMFIYDDVVGGKIGELMLSPFSKRSQLNYADSNHESLTM
jgi:hypothetical protein